MFLDHDTTTDQTGSDDRQDVTDTLGEIGEGIADGAGKVKDAVVDDAQQTKDDVEDVVRGEDGDNQ